MRFQGQTHNIDAVLGEVARLSAKGEDLGPLFAALANELYTLAEYALENEQDPDGGAWRPLAPATRAQKLKRHGFARRLHESGELRLRLRLNPDEAAVRVYNFLHTLAIEAQLFARACGKTNIHSLELEDLAALTMEASALAQVPLAGSQHTVGRPDMTRF